MARNVKGREIDKAVRIIKGFGATRIILFGSCARGSPNAADIDIAIGGIRADSFFTLMGRLIRELESRVDIVDLDETDDYLTKRIMEEGEELL